MENNEIISFEDFKNKNGITYWWASDFMIMLGYDNLKTFTKVINKATKTLITLNIPHFENIIAVNRTSNGEDFTDFKLTRFACYIIAMNGDNAKTEVAMAQAYFAEQTRKFELYERDPENFERLLTREDLIDGNKSLASVIDQAGVENYAKFQNAGYLGMYNMTNWDLKEKRGVDKNKNLFDTMSRTEMAANLFRVTQTEELVKRKGIKGQTALEQTHNIVGKQVRGIVKENTGLYPEDLPQTEALPQVKNTIKLAYKNMKKQDK